MIALKNAMVFDGIDKNLKPVDTVLISDRIEALGSDIPLPQGTSVLDLSGKYLLPGFIDAHTHISGTGRMDRPGGIWAKRYDTYNYAEFREACLDYGITTVRTCGDRLQDTLDFRELQHSGKILAPKTLLCGKIFQALDGYPFVTILMQNPEYAKETCIFADSETVDISEEIHKLKELGIDWIKIFCGHTNAYDLAHPIKPELNEQQVAKIVEAAHKEGLPVMCHVDTLDELEYTARAGVDMVEHISFDKGSSEVITEDQIRILKDNGTIVDPTVVVYQKLMNSFGLNPTVLATIESSFIRLREAGIPMVMGCDSGSLIPFGETLHEEMENYVRLGYTNAETLAIATACNAKYLNIGNYTGSIEPGKAADLLVLDKNPLEDIRNTRSIRIVIQDGQIVRDTRHI